MRIIVSCLSVFFILLFSFSVQAFVIENKIFRENIRTPLAFPSGNPTGYPMVELFSTLPIEFHFDQITDEKSDYQFAIFHCNSKWEVSEISEIEYLSGFSNQDINDVEYSFNTAIDFVHYHFDYPSSMSKPTVSGNYGVVVYDGDDPFESAVVTFRILVYENYLAIDGEVVNSSIISERFKSQEIDFNIGFGALSVTSPARDLKTVVLQNADWNTAIYDLKPSFIRTNELIYDLNGPNNFSGGSEWRAFEIKSVKFASLQVDRIVQEDFLWHAYLRKDILRGGRAYQSDFDLNGKCFIRNDLGDDSHLEAEYIYVHFELEMPEFSVGKVFVECSETEFQAKKFEMTFDKTSKSYKATVLLKQGYYDYRYNVIDPYHPKGDISVTEGNHNETENDYHVVVYFSDIQRGCERIVGIAALNSVSR